MVPGRFRPRHVGADQTDTPADGETQERGYSREVAHTPDCHLTNPAPSASRHERTRSTASAGASADAFGAAEEVSRLKGLVTALPVGSASQMTDP